MVKLAGLKSIRERRALTQQQLADKAGINRVTIARLEGGTDHPFPTTIRKLADALGVNPESLLEPTFIKVDHLVPLIESIEWLSAADKNRILGGNARELRSPSERTGGSPRSFDRLVRGNRAEVDNLLGRQPELARVVEDAVDELSRRIPEARLSLEVVRDAEFGDDEQLLLGIATNLPGLEAEQALDRFDREWWVPRLPRVGGLLCIDFVYR